MKTITFETLLLDGEHISLKPEKISEYPDTVKHSWQFFTKSIKTGDLLKVEGLLNKRTELFRPDGQPNADSFFTARAEETLLLILTDWNYCDQSGSTLAITRENILGLPYDVFMTLYQQVRIPTIPTPEEMAEQVKN